MGMQCFSRLARHRPWLPAEWIWFAALASFGKALLAMGASALATTEACCWPPFPSRQNLLGPLQLASPLPPPVFAQVLHHGVLERSLDGTDGGFVSLSNSSFASLSLGSPSRAAAMVAEGSQPPSPARPASGLHLILALTPISLSSSASNSVVEFRQTVQFTFVLP